MPNIGPVELVLIVAMLAIPILAVVLVGVSLSNRWRVDARAAQWPQQSVAPPAAPATLADRLTQLEQAKAAGLVTDDEYAAARDKILANA